MSTEMPTMLSNSLGALNTSYSPSAFYAASSSASPFRNRDINQMRDEHLLAAIAETAGAAPVPAATPTPSKTRLVQVFIADTDENLPLEQRILHKGDQKVTDLEDNELFFDIDVKSMLEKHNAVRTATRNKKVKDKEEFLEPARVRDLKMTVVTIAQF